MNAFHAGKTDDAARLFKKVLRRQPRHVGALNLLGVALLRLGRFAEAETFLHRALTEHGTSDVTLYNCGLVLKALKRPAEALDRFTQALAINSSVAETWNNRGTVFNDLKRHDEAIDDFDKALVLRPDYAEAYGNKGKSLLCLERFEEAGSAFDRALALNPGLAEAWCGRGTILDERKQYAAALAAFDAALGRRPELAEAWDGRANVLAKLAHYDKALAAYDKAIALKPDFADAFNNLGNLLKDLGQLQRARQSFVEALRIDPNNARCYYNVAELKTFASGDPQLAAMEALAAKSDGLSASDRICLDFALGKACADLEHHDRSFQHYLAGNAAKRAAISYDETSEFAVLDRTEAIFSRELIEAKSGCGDPSPAPIFVVGMPRSGTTLVEQIIASHPLAHGAGELTVFGEIIHGVSVRGPDGGQASFPEYLPFLDAATLKQIGTRYIASVRDLMAANAAADCVRVTDKMPANFRFAGLIHLALPSAKIIHLVRDPVDTCISCFSKLFTTGQYQTYNLGELGRYYKRYERLMAHWRRVLPAGRILDIRYEDVIADLEGQARRIIAHCDLPWDDRCLSFHQTDRPVRTASATQVRRPIYSSAVGRWRVYEKHLGPLLDALGIESAD